MWFYRRHLLVFGLISMTALGLTPLRGMADRIFPLDRRASLDTREYSSQPHQLLENRLPASIAEERVEDGRMLVRINRNRIIEVEKVDGTESLVGREMNSGVEFQAIRAAIEREGFDLANIKVLEIVEIGELP